MDDKFFNVPVEDDTTIGFQSMMKLGDFDVLYQGWYWNGIDAESIIFSDDDVKGMSEHEIRCLVKSSDIVNEDSQNNDSHITFKRNQKGFTFVNFNFKHILSTMYDDEGCDVESAPLSPEEQALKSKTARAHYGKKNDEELARLAKMKAQGDR